MHRTTAKLLSILGLIVFIPLCILFSANGNQAGLIITTILWIAMEIVTSYFMRCPHCGAWPRKGSFFHEYCPKCGENLND